MSLEWVSGLATGIVLYGFVDNIVWPWLAHLMTTRRAHGKR